MCGRYRRPSPATRTGRLAPCFGNERNLLTTESKKRPINSQRLASEFVIDEARLLEPLHEETNARPCGAHHFCQRLMIYFRNRFCGRSHALRSGRASGEYEPTFSHSDCNIGQLSPAHIGCSLPARMPRTDSTTSLAESVRASLLSSQFARGCYPRLQWRMQCGRIDPIVSPCLLTPRHS